MPREQLDEPSYALDLGDGQKVHLVHVLLRKMICEREKRLTDMKEVIEELGRIRNWQSPTQAMLGQRARRLLENHTATVSETDRIHSLNENARAAEREAVVLVKEGFDTWASNALQQVADEMRIGSAFTDISSKRHENSRLRAIAINRRYNILGEWQLSYATSKRHSQGRHLLRILLCEHIINNVRVKENGRNALPELVPQRNLPLAMLALYAKAESFDEGIYSAEGFFSQKEMIGSTIERLPQGNQTVFRRLRVERLMGEFDPAISKHAVFVTSDWPNNINLLNASLSEMIELFVEEISDPTPFVPG